MSEFWRGEGNRALCCAVRHPATNETKRLPKSVAQPGAEIVIILLNTNQFDALESGSWSKPDQVRICRHYRRARTRPERHGDLVSAIAQNLRRIAAVPRHSAGRSVGTKVSKLVRANSRSQSSTISSIPNRHHDGLLPRYLPQADNRGPFNGRSRSELSVHTEPDNVDRPTRGVVGGVVDVLVVDGKVDALDDG